MWSALPFLFVLLLLSCYSTLDSTIVTPQGSTFQDLCPGDKVVIICNVSRPDLNWKWLINDMEVSLTFNIRSNEVLNFTFPVDLVISPQLKFMLSDYHTSMPQYLTSSLEYFISDDFIENTITCNDATLSLIKNCSELFDNFMLNNFTNAFNSSSVYLTWTTDITRELTYGISSGVNESNYKVIPHNQNTIKLFLQHDVNYSITIKLNSYHNNRIIAMINLTLQNCGNFCTIIQSTILNNGTVIVKSFLFDDNMNTTNNILLNISSENSTIVTNTETEFHLSSFNAPAGKGISYFVFAATCASLFILVLVMTIFGFVIGWKASIYYEQRKVNQLIVVKKKSTKAEIISMEQNKAYENIPTEIIAETSNGEMDLCQNLAYASVSTVKAL